MAKWGEGDPRWIVEERPDATNVNNWHWTEKNASPWSIAKIKELFKDFRIECALIDVRVEEVEKCEGEASANNRKGKLIFFYEWDLVLKWSGTLLDGTGATHHGTINIPNLSEENKVNELDIQISLKDPDEEGDRIKQVLYRDGRDPIRHQLSKYISGLREEFSQGMILPKKDERDQVKPDNIKNLTSGFNKQINVSNNAQPNCAATAPAKVKVGKSNIDTKTIQTVHKFQCKAKEFYDCLTRVELVTAFTRAHVKMEPVKGGKFELFGGNIVGSFEELVPEKRIVQQWRYKQWPAGHYSLVTLKIEEKDDHTEVSLEQVGVPTNEVDVTRDNWQRYYWDSIKQAFGFGSILA